MNNKRGFTLVEMLAVIAIIAAMTALVIPSIILVKDKINERAYQAKKEIILLAAQTYGQNNPNLFDEVDEVTVSIGFLLKNGYLAKDVDNTSSVCSSSYGCVIDPRDKKNINSYSVLIEKNNGNVSTSWIADDDTGGLVYTASACFTFNSGTKTITAYDFENCPSNVVIPESIGGVAVENIGQAAFAGVIDNQECYIDSDGNPAIYDSWNWYSKANNYVHYSGDGYGGCWIETDNTHPLVNVVIPNTVKTIGTNAFTYNSFTSIVIPDSVTSIGDGAFAYNYIDEISFSKNIDTIGFAAFSENALTSLRIPDNIKYIGAYAFNYNFLISLNLGNEVITIGEAAFSDNQLKNITWSNKVTIVGAVAFENNELSSVTIPNSVTQLGDYSFETNYITTGNAKVDNSSTNPNPVITIRTGVFAQNGANQNQTIAITYLR